MIKFFLFLALGAGVSYGSDLGKCFENPFSDMMCAALLSGEGAKQTSKLHNFLKSGPEALKNLSVEDLLEIKKILTKTIKKSSRIAGKTDPSTFHEIRAEGTLANLLKEKNQ